MATIEIAPGWVDAIQRYIEGLLVNSIAAAESATETFREAVAARARADEDWSSLADNIQVWSQDGLLHIGVRTQEFTSLAELLEFGDMDQAPNPLFRTLTSEARDASAGMRSQMEAHYGPMELE